MNVTIEFFYPEKDVCPEKISPGVFLLKAAIRDSLLIRTKEVQKITSGFRMDFSDVGYVALIEGSEEAEAAGLYVEPKTISSGFNGEIHFNLRSVHDLQKKVQPHMPVAKITFLRVGTDVVLGKIKKQETTPMKTAKKKVSKKKTAKKKAKK